MRRSTVSVTRQQTYRCARRDSHLPGPNQPVDFDTGPFITQGLSPSTGKPVRYYNFDIQGTTPAPLYVMYRDREDKPVAGQLDIIDTLPGEKGYNDFRQVWKVSVPKDYVANTITDAGALSQAGYKSERTDTLRNMPVVPDKSIARERLNGESTETTTRLVSRPSGQIFQLRRGAVSGASVPLSPIYVSFNINPGEPNGDLASGFRTEPNSEQTHNIPGYTARRQGVFPVMAARRLR